LLVIGEINGKGFEPYTFEQKGSYLFRLTE
jgi:hypothetical protein